MTDKFRVSFFGGVGSVTGANFLLEGAGLSILVDCGLVQGGKSEVNRDPFAYDPGSIDYLFLTHAHADHIGRVPKLMQEGFAGKIYSTPETESIARVMFEDAVRLLESEAKEEGVLPLYERQDVEKAFQKWNSVKYREEVSLSPQMSFRLLDAGHILGSSMIEFTVDGPEKKKILFTGDLGNSPATLLRDTEDPENINFLVMDSVYGDRNHESKEERESKFFKIASATIERGGTLLIPAFSLERTQVLLYELDNLFESGKLPQVPVYLDSPLAIKLTDIYEKATEHYNSEVQGELARGDKIFSWKRLKETARAQDSMAIAKVAGPKIILAGSGMSTGGRVLHHEKRFLPDPNTTFLIVGYQASGTLGRQIQDGAKEVEIDGEKISVNARIETISGYSSHKDSDHLVEFVEKTAETLEKAFVVMGEYKSATFLAQRLRDYAGVEAIVPKQGDKYELF